MNDIFSTVCWLQKSKRMYLDYKIKTKLSSLIQEQYFCKSTMSICHRMSMLIELISKQWWRVVGWKLQNILKPMRGLASAPRVPLVKGPEHMVSWEMAEIQSAFSATRGNATARTQHSPMYRRSAEKGSVGNLFCLSNGNVFVNILGKNWFFCTTTDPASLFNQPPTKMKITANQWSLLLFMELILYVVDNFTIT